MTETKEIIIEDNNKEQVDDEKKWCVYCHTNKLNNKKYFGITCLPVNRRWKKNGNGYRDQIVFFGVQFANIHGMDLSMKLLQTI